MKALYTAVIAATLSTTATADILSVHCPAGCPSNPDNNDLVFGHVYSLSNNPATKFADWVAYEVDIVNFGASPGRKWASDPLLHDSETLEKGDYTGRMVASLKLIEVTRRHWHPLRARTTGLS